MGLAFTITLDESCLSLTIAFDEMGLAFTITLNERGLSLSIAFDKRSIQINIEVLLMSNHNIHVYFCGEIRKTFS